MKKLFLVFTCLLTLFLITPAVHAEGSYEVNTLTTNVTVYEDGKIDVVQKINVNFSNCDKLIWELSNNYDYYWNLAGQDLTKHYQWKVSDLNVEGYLFSLVNEENVSYAMIAEEGSNLDGKKIITVSYSMQLEDLGVGNIQKFSYTILPRNTNKVNCLSFTITMPEIFDIEALKFYYDNQLVNNTEIDFNYQIVGTSIEGYVNTPIDVYRDFNMTLDLAYDYFTFKQQMNVSIIIVVASILTMIFSLISFVLFGKDGLIRKAKTCLPPDGLNAASVGYVCDGRISYRDIACLVVEWANLGYLKIEEVPDVDNLYFVKLMDMGKERWKYERKLFNAVFYERDEVFANELDKYFYPYVSNAIKEIETIYSKQKDNRVFTKSSLVMQLISFILAIVPIFVGITYAFYYKYYHLEISMMVAFIVSLIALVIEVIWYGVVSRKNTFHKWQYIGALSICAVLSYLFAYGYNYLFSLTINTFGVCYATLACTMVVVLVMLFMDKRTALGKAWYGEILGFKEFIENATEDELRVLIQDDPAYFYYVLPYAYTLGVSDIWFKKCNSFNLPLPSWYKGKKQVTLHLFEPRYYRLLDIIRRHITVHSILHK